MHALVVRSSKCWLEMMLLSNLGIAWLPTIITRVMGTHARRRLLEPLSKGLDATQTK